MLSSHMIRRTLPMILASFSALLMVFEYFFRTTQGTWLAGTFRTWSIVIVSFTFLVAFIVTTIRHLRIIQKKTPREWIYSIIVLATLWSVTSLGIAMGPRYPLYTWIFDNIVTSVYGAMIGSTAFFVASAGYRALRARTREAFVLLLSTVLVMLGNVTIGEVIWPGFGPISQWIMDVGVTSGTRGLVITIAFGFMALCLRIIAGLETSWLGD